MINKLQKYLFTLSPIILTSFFIPYSKFPVWAITVLLGSMFSAVVLSIYVFSNWKKEKAFGNFVINSVVLLGTFLSIAYAFIGNSLFFSLWGKGIAAYSTVTFLSLVAVFFLSTQLKNKANKIMIIASAISLAISLLSFIFLQYIPFLGNIFGYTTIPMLSFGTLLCYPVFYALLTLAGSLLSFYSEKKNYNFLFKFTKFFKYFYLVLAIILAISFVGNLFRFVAANNYLKAVGYANSNDLVNARKYLDSAISVAPFDTYYLARIELTKVEIKNLISSNATNTQKLQEDYTKLINMQIDDSNKAVAYDKKNPQNYIALGLAYESAIPVIGDEAYKKALENYEKARNLVNDKDYVDTIKAKLAFGAQKEQEGLGFLDQALRYNASSGPALYTSSQYFASKKDFKLATDYAEKAVIAFPTASDARMNLGILYFANKDLDKAIEQFKAAFTINQNDNVALYYLAAAYKVSGNIPFAKEVIAVLEQRVGNTEDVRDLKKGLEDKKVEEIETKK